MVTIGDCLMNWNLEPYPYDVLASADVIITHEFGDQHNVSATTRAIVERGVELAKKFNKPLICQYPGNKVAEAAGIKPIYVIEKHLLKPGEYLETEEVNRQVANVCKHHRWDRTIVVAHPHHEWRAVLNLRRRGITVYCPETKNIPYDSNLDRFWLKSPLRFIPREIVARLLYRNKDWI